MGGWSPQAAAELRRAAAIARAADDAGDDPAEVLYRRWFAAPAGGEETSSEPADQAVPFHGLLRDAHAGSTRWRPATVIARGAAGVLVVRQDAGPPRAVVRGEYVHEDRSPRCGLMPTQGERISVRDRRDAPPSEGWWRTWGAGWNLLDPPADLARLYLAPTLGGISRVVGVATDALQRGPEPWMLKVVAHRSALDRPDAMVVYLQAPLDRLCASPLVERLRQGAMDDLRDHRPPFTLDLGRGIAAAEEPGDGRSFGEATCALLGAALADRPGDDVMLDVVARRFGEAGVDPAHPYRRARAGVW